MVAAAGVGIEAGRETPLERVAPFCTVLVSGLFQYPRIADLCLGNIAHLIAVCDGGHRAGVTARR